MDENKSVKTNVSLESAGLKLAGHLHTRARYEPVPPSYCRQGAGRGYVREVAQKTSLSANWIDRGPPIW
jgi:hypothetical protein